MSSASKTPNLNLPQWAANEKPEQTDFNSAFGTIDSLIDSGSNEYGDYVKFPDGTMICHGRILLTGVNITTSFGAEFRNDALLSHSLPLAFVGAPVLSAQIHGGGSLSVKYGIMVSNLSSSSMSYYLMSNASRSAVSLYVSFFAVGRWK